MGSHWPFGHLKHKLWPKERLGVKMAIWISTTKSRELTRFPCMQVTCNIPLESSQQGIQLCFGLYYNRRCSRQVMRLQSCRSPSCGNFGTCTWESWVSQPHFGLSVRVKPTLPKVGTWSPPGLLKIQSSSWRPKTPRIKVFLVSLERSWSVDV
jgi:hypothetical protein